MTTIMWWFAIGIILAFLQCLQVKSTTISIITNLGSQYTLNSYLLTLGHQCYEEGISASGYFGWHTESGASCYVNVDQIKIELSGNSGVSCSVYFDNMFQRVNYTDIQAAIGLLIDISGINICATPSITGIDGGSSNIILPTVSSLTTCPVCNTSSSVSSTALYNGVAVRNIHPTAKVTMIMYDTNHDSGDCYTTSISANGGYTYLYNGDDHACSGYPTNWVFESDGYLSCVATFSSTSDYTASGVIIGNDNNNGGQLCVSTTTASLEGTTKITSNCSECTLS